MSRRIRVFKYSLRLALAILVVGFLVPEKFSIPVSGATAVDWHPDSFWYEPWGVSGVHKGIDIFGAKSTPVRSSTSGVVIFAGELKRGGNVVAVLGPRWRIHYYAHLDTTDVSVWSFLSSADRIGSVGDSGNARGKPPHLHYSIVSIVPYLWEATTETQGWKKMFYLDPTPKVLAASLSAAT